MKKSKLKSKKKVQANKKLITVVITVAVIIVGLVGSLWFYNQFKSADRNIAAGDALFQEGSFSKASKQYGRAVHKNPTNLFYIEKLQNSILATVPVTPEEANALYRSYIGTLVHNARYNPLDADTQFKWLYELYGDAILTGYAVYWEQMQDAADTILDRLRLDDPRRYEAKIYRGMSFLRLEDKSMTDTFDDAGNIRFPGELDLLDALEHDLGNALAWSALAHGRMAVYYRLVADGRIAQAEKNREVAEQTMRDALEAAGDSLEVLTVYAKEVLLQSGRLRSESAKKRGSVSVEEIEEMELKVEVALQNVISAFDPARDYLHTGNVSKLILEGSKDGLNLTVELLRKYLDLHDDDYRMRLALASILHQLKRYDEAEKEATALLEAEQGAVSVQAIEQFNMRPVAANILFVVARDRWELAQDEDKEQFLTQAKEHREVISDFVSGDLTHRLLLEADGDLSLIQKDFRNAATKFEELISRYPYPISTEKVYVKSGIAYANSGSPGLARDRFSDLLRIAPNNLNSYILKAQAELSLFDHDAAAETLALLPQVTRENSSTIVAMLDRITFLAQAGESTKFNDPIISVLATASRLSSLGDSEGAVEVLQRAIDSLEQPDWRLYRTLAVAYYIEEDFEATLLWLDKAIALKPEMRRLKDLRVVVELNDRVASIIAITETRDFSEATEAATIAAKLFVLSATQSSRAKYLSSTGSHELAQEAQELSDRAKEESSKYQSIADALGSDLSSIILLKFEEALKNNELNSAQQFLDQLVEKEVDPIIIGNSEVQLHLVRAARATRENNHSLATSESGKAYQVATTLVKAYPNSDMAQRILGDVYVEENRGQEALEAYMTAYRIDPNEEENVRRYVGAMVRTNADHQRIMRVVRQARNSFPNNAQLLEVWLWLEFEYGNRGEVLTYRFSRFGTKPNDRNNKLQLALLLVNIQPSRDLLLEPNGTVVYTIKEWSRLTTEQQVDKLEELQVQWDSVVNSIMNSTASEPDLDIRTAIIHASIERDRGRFDAACSILDKFIEKRKDAEDYTQSVVAVANFLQDLQRFVKAKSMLESAMDSQSDAKEISATLGFLLFAPSPIQDYERAAQELSYAAQSSGDSATYSMWIEALVYSGKFEEAEAAIEGVNSTNAAYTKAMLQSLIHHQKSEMMLAQGNSIEGRIESEKSRAAFSRAIEADGANPIPRIRLCNSLINEYLQTQDPKLLKEALEVSSSGDFRNTANEEYAIVRTRILQADGQLRRAIEDLDIFLAKVPTADLVREKLISAHLDADDLDKAIEVAISGVAVDPASAKWHRRLGDIHILASDNRKAAVLSYLKALELDPSPQLLTVIGNITRTDKALPYRKLIAMTRGEMASQHPTVKTIEAKALLGLGQRRDSELAMAAAWSEFEVAIKNGWVAPSMISSWFADLTIIFADEHEAGEQFALQLIGENPSPESLIGLATYWWEQDHKYIDRSLALINKVITDPKTQRDLRLGAITQRGAYLVEDGQYEEGAMVFRQLDKEYPNTPVVINNLSYIIGVYLNKPEEGLALAKRAVKLAPRNPSLIDTISTLYELLGKFKQASETLEFLLQVDPVNSKAMARLSLLYAGTLDRPERALQLAKRARSQQPRSPVALDALGWSYIQVGQHAKGERFLKLSLTNGETSSAYIHLAQLVMMENQFAEATGFLRIAEELSKNQHTLDRINVLKDDIRKMHTTVGE